MRSTRGVSDVKRLDSFKGTGTPADAPRNGPWVGRAVRACERCFRGIRLAGGTIDLGSSAVMRCSNSAFFVEWAFESVLGQIQLGGRIRVHRK